MSYGIICDVRRALQPVEHLADKAITSLRCMVLREPLRLKALFLINYSVLSNAFVSLERLTTVD